MADKKKNNTYWFTVEGETEQLYLDRLRQLINTADAATHTVTIERKVEQRPIKYAKTVTVIGKTKRDITHWFDYESSDPDHVIKFKNIMSEIKGSNGLGKMLKYHPGYSNLTFELWMVLHKIDCSFLAHRDHHLRHINRAFGEEFTELDSYKQQSNFQRVLGKISLEDVKAAIRRAKSIMRRNEENGLRLLEYKGFKYYTDNPSLTIHESVERILKDCGLM
jgi:hypothetical protein